MAKAPAAGSREARSDSRNGRSDTKVVRELAEILADTGLTEIEVERGDLRVRVVRSVTVSAATHVVEGPAVAPSLAASPQAPAAEEPARTDAADPSAHPGAVPSPMVGTAYLSPEPGAAAFITVGQTLKAGDTLLLIEAMKTFNPITAPRAGKVLEILVSDSQPVEFGETLVILG